MLFREIRFCNTRMYIPGSEDFPVDGFFFFHSLSVLRCWTFVLKVGGELSNYYLFCHYVNDNENVGIIKISG